jgi:hypothetical protein
VVVIDKFLWKERWRLSLPPTKACSPLVLIYLILSTPPQHISIIVFHIASLHSRKKGSTLSAGVLGDGDHVTIFREFGGWNRLHFVAPAP